MWRAFFCAVGISLLVLGGECMVVEKAVLAVAPKQETAPASSYLFMQNSVQTSPREIKPPEWAPWTLLSAGAVVVLYTLTVSRGSS